MDNSKAKTNRLHNFDLCDFKRAQQAMVSATDNAYNGIFNGRVLWGERTKVYTDEEVKKIISSGSVCEQRELSRNYFNENGYYKELVMHYATLLKYSGILIPNPASGKNLSTTHISKKYFSALDYIDNMHLPIILSQIAQKVLINGTYFGLLSASCDKSVFSMIDLPVGYCLSRLRDCFGNDLVEFDISYFDSISDPETKRATLAAYPDFIVKAYRRWSNGKMTNKWLVLPAELGVCFSLFSGRPFFLNVIPAIIQHGESVDTEQEREEEEIRKIIVQKIPHLNDGRLLFEPDEAVEIHEGTVGMVRNNKNTSVITTYGDVDAISSKTTGENTGTLLERMRQNIYSQAGVSGEIFAASGGNTTDVSLKYDTAIMMNLANKFARFITDLINRFFSNSNINFKFTILPITYYNEEKFVDSSFKLAQAGFSLVMPAVAMGMSQRDLVNMKDLENDVLKLTEKLIPPQTAFTQSGDSAEGGRPQKEEEEKRDQTIKNEESIEKSKTQGGSK